MKIRQPKSTDLSALIQILEDTELFPAELLGDLIEPFFSDVENTEKWLVLETDEAGVIGFSYTRPEALAEGVWNLLAIGFRKEQQGKGFGTKLIAEVEKSLKKERILLVETSGLDDFKATRDFYEKCGYTREAVIRNYWADGDDKVIFSKSL